MTKREVYTATIEILNASNVENKAELIKAYESYIEKLATTSKKPNEENEHLKAVILEVLADGGVYTIDGLKAQNEELAQYGGSQKISALLTQLDEKHTNQIKRVKKGKKTYFALADTEVDLETLDA